MRCSLDKVLLDARQLANRIRATDETADILIKQASDAHHKIISKKQCQEEILAFDDLNQTVRNRPRSRLMMCIAAENKQLELLKQDNKVLRTSLIEYETTFEMIMNKFRKHKSILKKLDELEREDFSLKNVSAEHELSTENRIIIISSKVTELKRAIEKALTIDNKVTENLSEIETKLILENHELRRVIEICREFQNGYNLSEDIESSILSVDYSRSQSPLKTYRSKHTSNPMQDRAIVNGIAKERNKTLYSSTSKIMSKFPLKIINHNTNNNNGNDHSSPRNSKSEIVIDYCATFSDDDDDRSSVASDASVKTLI